MTGASPCVSVILPTYNRAHLLVGAAQTVLSQSFTDLELIIVDDASTDETPAVVAALNDSRVVYHRRSHNGGVSAARNTGLALARGRYVAFQDSDDEWVQEKLACQMADIDPDDPLTVSLGVVLRRVGDMLRSWPPHGAEHSTAGCPPGWLVATAAAYSQAIVAPRALLLEIGGFDETLCAWEDWDLMLRLSQRAHFSICEASMVISTRQPDSLTADTSRFGAIQARLLDKHADLLRRFPGAYARLQYVAGRYLLQAGDRRAARQRFVSAISICPTHIKSWLGLLGALAPWHADRLPMTPRVR